MAWRHLWLSPAVISAGGPARSPSNAGPCHAWRMVTYEVTSTGPKGYQVTVISPEFRGAVVGDFCSLEVAEAFADSMREIDTAGFHSDTSSAPV